MRRLISIGIPLIFAGLALVFLPRGIKWYVERAYPVQVEAVRLGWPVHFYGVRVNLPNIHGELQEVLATPSGAVRVQGGNIFIVRKGTEKNSVPTEGKRQILLRDLQVTVEADDFLLTLSGVARDQDYTFESGHLTLANGQDVTLQAGVVSRDLQTASFQEVQAGVTLPVTIPEIPRRGTVTAKNVAVNRQTRSATIREVTYGPLVAEGVTLRKTTEIEATLHTITVQHPWLDVGPLTLRDVQAKESAGKISAAIGKTSLTVDPHLYEISGSGTCSDWLQALPDQRPSVLRISPESFTSGNIIFDVRARDHGKVDLKFDCKFDCSSEPIKALSAPKLTYTAYSSKGELFERTLSKGSDWVNIEDLPAHVSKAFITLEDPGYLGHRGIIVQALRNSLEDNLKLGEFFRGGSTITQQLAKNLWLRRDKTLSRKVYEALLSMALESCLSKEKILELYLNVVEYGPDLYGLKPAAKRYFDKDPEDLLPEEAFYLASLLPHPSKAVPPDRGGLDYARKLMTVLVTKGFLPDVYLPTSDIAEFGEWQTLK